MAKVPRKVLVPLGWLGFVGALSGLVWARYAQDPTPEPRGQLVFEDAFERGEVGGDYLPAKADQGWEAGTWIIENGRLKGQGIHNATLWLQKPLPEKVRIEVDVRAEGDKGDLKVEAFGDGRMHQSGYIFIYGGWSNKIITLAHNDEHSEDRKVDNRPCAQPGGKTQCVVPGLDYHWTIERTDDTVRWYVDGALMLTYPYHPSGVPEHFGFGNWESPTTFDNLKIYDLAGTP
ncbi:MAG: hypothetical protein ACE366_05060 [Bradymonadia bacterium]